MSYSCIKTGFHGYSSLYGGFTRGDAYARINPNIPAHEQLTDEFCACNELILSTCTPLTHLTQTTPFQDNLHIFIKLGGYWERSSIHEAAGYYVGVIVVPPGGWVWLGHNGEPAYLAIDRLRKLS